MSANSTAKFIKKKDEVIGKLQAEVNRLQKLAENDKAQKATIADLEAKVGRLVSLQSADRVQYVELVDSSTVKQRELNQKIANYEHDFRNLRGQASELESENKALRKANERNQEELKDARVAIMELENTITELRAKDKDAKSLRSRLQTKSTELETANRMLRQARETMENAGLLRKPKVQPVTATTPSKGSVPDAPIPSRVLMAGQDTAPTEKA